MNLKSITAEAKIENIALVTDFVNSILEKNECSMKVQMESPGLLHFISKKKNILSTVGILVLLINGGGLEFNNKDFQFKLKTDGIIKNVSEFLDRKTDREMRDKIKDSLDSLQINTPDDFQKAMIELYKTQNANRKAY